PLSVTVLAALVVAIGMMFTLGRGLAVIPDPEEPYLAAIGRTLFPFVLIYLGWNLYTVDLSEVLRADAQRLADAGDAINAGNILQLPIVVCLVVALGSWGLRLLCERRHDERPGRMIGLLTSFFEVNFTLYALYSVVQLIKASLGSPPVPMVSRVGFVTQALITRRRFASPNLFTLVTCAPTSFVRNRCWSTSRPGGTDAGVPAARRPPDTQRAVTPASKASKAPAAARARGRTRQNDRGDASTMWNT
ncbi:MAG: hypothetical protein ACJ768_06085, partial [Gaiellaceae bacterium]